MTLISNFSTVVDILVRTFFATVVGLLVRDFRERPARCLSGRRGDGKSHKRIGRRSVFFVNAISFILRSLRRIWDWFPFPWAHYMERAAVAIGVMSWLRMAATMVETPAAVKPALTCVFTPSLGGMTQYLLHQP